MATKIINFNPLSEEEVQKAESEIDSLLNDQWQIISVIGGNRTGNLASGGTFGISADSPRLPVSKDYVVLILHK